MNLRELATAIDGTILVETNSPDVVIDRAFAADLLSDVLSMTEERTTLVTGMVNPQVMRVAEILNVTALIVVRGKVPPQSMLDYAARLSIPVVTTKRTMFETCGLMYARGVRACKTKPILPRGACA